MAPTVEQLHSLSDILFSEFAEDASKTDYIDQAVILDRQALRLCPRGHPARILSLHQLAFHLGDRYNNLRAMADCEEAIAIYRQLLDICPRRHPLRLVSLNCLSMLLSSRFSDLGLMADLDEAIAFGEEEVALHPRGHFERYMALHVLATNLSIRYKRLSAIPDLEKAISFGREALHICPQQHPFRPASANNLANSLSIQYERLGEMKHLDEATIFVREALDLCPHGHPDRPMYLDNLADFLFARFNRLGKMTDLDTAILSAEEALQLSPPGHLHRPISLDCLSILLLARYRRLGTMPDLEKAISLSRKSLRLCSKEHSHRSTSLHNLAESLHTRYRHLTTMTDLNEGIGLAREALDLLPEGHHLRITTLNNLGLYLSARFNEMGETSDIDEAVVFGREALRLSPRGHVHRSVTMHNLSVHLTARYRQLETMTDLDEAIVLDRAALDLCPVGHPDRSLRLDGLAVDLFARYRRTGEATDLDNAIDLARDTLSLRPPGHPDRSQSLQHLASYLLVRFRLSKNSKDKEDLFDLHVELTNVPRMASASDLRATKAWVMMAEEFHHPSMILAYETSLRLLLQHLASLPSLPQHLPILKDLTSSLAVDAFSACLRNQDIVKAVELLEQGRGVFWGQRARLRSPLDDILAAGLKGKELADEFTRLASRIRTAMDLPGENQHNRICRLNLELQKVVANIRQLVDHSRFLLPPLFSELQRAAIGGPVIVVNASEYTCDAVTVFADRDPVHIPLEVTKDRVQGLALQLQSLTAQTKMMDVTRDFILFLRDVWDEVVSPIVDVLQTTVPLRSRVWWCPTAEFSSLPLHAAGPYRRGQRNMTHLYISSYTPTLTALIRARRHQPSKPTEKKPRLVAIGQATAMGESELLSVGSELDIVGDRVKDLATFTRIEGTESSISRISKELGKNEWVHLACHGLADVQRPFESAFALHDGCFTIERIMRCELEDPEFAYLSACHTTVGDEESPDEVIHLASAMQFAGFRSVIGTMWAVDDGYTNAIASAFYGHMVDESGHLDHTRAALALNQTMSRLVDVPFDQRILYVHIGA